MANLTMRSRTRSPSSCLKAVEDGTVNAVLRESCASTPARIGAAGVGERLIALAHEHATEGWADPLGEKTSTTGTGADGCDAVLRHQTSSSIYHG